MCSWSPGRADHSVDFLKPGLCVQSQPCNITGGHFIITAPSPQRKKIRTKMSYFLKLHLVPIWDPRLPSDPAAPAPPKLRRQGPATGRDLHDFIKLAGVLRWGCLGKWCGKEQNSGRAMRDLIPNQERLSPGQFRGLI